MPAGKFILAQRRRTFHSDILQFTVLLYHRGPNQEWFHWSHQAKL